jgi:hypothetical protein
MYEHRSHPLLPRKMYIQRLLRHGSAALVVLTTSLTIGILGYHFTEKFSWIDSLLNASMILGGMGPVNPLETNAGKFFASFYSIFSGIVFLLVSGILLAPVVHRFLHRLHLESNASSKND